MVSAITRNLRLIWRLMMDRRVPLSLKMIVPATLLYLISPVDLAPDLFLGLGQLDDVAIVLLGLALFLQLCPRAIVQQHLREIYSTATRHGATQDGSSEEGNYIETAYQVMENDNQQE